MYINLILGIAALAGIWALLYRLLVKPDPPAKALDPAAILARELEERRSREEETKAAWERVQDAAAQQLAPVIEALSAMQNAMSAEQQDMGCLTWNKGEDGVLRVDIRKNALQETPRTFFVSWRLKDMDLRAVSLPHLTVPQGYYAVREGMEREAPLADLNAVVRHLAGLIADELA